ncbi:NBS-containing resistance-like protein [Tanacetum coccineum]
MGKTMNSKCASRLFLGQLKLLIFGEFAQMALLFLFPFSNYKYLSRNARLALVVCYEWKVGWGLTFLASALYSSDSRVRACSWIFTFMKIAGCYKLHAPLTTATLVYCDNVSVVYLSTNPVQHQRTKHIEIDIHFVRDYVASGQVCALHVPYRFQYADIFTKGLPSALFLEFRSSLNVRRHPVTTAGEY